MDHTKTLVSDLSQPSWFVRELFFCVRALEEKSSCICSENLVACARVLVNLRLFFHRCNQMCTSRNPDESPTLYHCKTVATHRFRPQNIDLCICLPLKGLEGGRLWNIGTHPIVWNRNFLPKFYSYFGPKMDLDGPFQP